MTAAAAVALALLSAAAGALLTRLGRSRPAPDAGEAVVDIAAETPVGFVAIDREGVITMATGEGLRRVLGPPERHPDDREPVREAVARADQEPVECQHRIRRADGVERWVRTRHPPGRGPEPRRDRRGPYERAHREGVPFAMTHRVVRDDGETRVVQQRSEVTLGEGDLPIRLIGTVQDVTEAHHAGQQLALGTGFDEGDVDRVFDPFFTRRRAGTGLGLSIVQRIVQDHGGEVVPSNRTDGPGAVVTISIPRVRQEAAE